MHLSVIPMRPRHVMGGLGDLTDDAGDDFTPTPMTGSGDASSQYFPTQTVTPPTIDTPTITGNDSTGYTVTDTSSGGNILTALSNLFGSKTVGSTSLGTGVSTGGLSPMMLLLLGGVALYLITRKK